MAGPYEPKDAILDVVRVEQPIFSNRFTQPLALDDEVLVLSQWVSFRCIQEPPLKIGPLVFALRALLVLRIRLVIGLVRHRIFNAYALSVEFVVGGPDAKQKPSI
jgi:hypothetical protein